MNLHVVRYQTSLRSIIGKLDIDGIYQCATIENVNLAIPEGTYKLIGRWSEKHQMVVLGICDVPGRMDIEVHIANWPEELKGCIAVGMTAGSDSVAKSREAFTALMDKFSEPATIQIESVHD